MYEIIWLGFWVIYTSGNMWSAPMFSVDKNHFDARDLLEIILLYTVGTIH